MDNICDGCPAAFALGAYIENADQDQDEPISPMRAGMIEHEAQVAGQALDKAAGRIACQNISKRPFDELPEVVPETGSSELIALTGQCPAMPYYLNERTGQPVALTKAVFSAAKITAKFRKKS